MPRAGARSRLEKLSKNELKRRMKAQLAAQKKAEKLAKQQAEQANKPKKPEDEEELDPTKYFENRCAQIAKIEAAGGNWYPHKFEVTISVPEFIEKYSHLGNGEHIAEELVHIAGRIMLKRSSGSKLVFYTLQGEGKSLQVMSSAADYEEGFEAFTQIHGYIKRGDIVGIVGYPGRAKRGELSVFPHKIIVRPPSSCEP